MSRSRRGERLVARAARRTNERWQFWRLPPMLFPWITPAKYRMRPSAGLTRSPSARLIWPLGEPSRPRWSIGELAIVLSGLRLARPWLRRTDQPDTFDRIHGESLVSGRCALAVLSGTSARRGCSSAHGRVDRSRASDREESSRRAARTTFVSAPCPPQPRMDQGWTLLGPLQHRTTSGDHWHLLRDSQHSRPPVGGAGSNGTGSSIEGGCGLGRTLKLQRPCRPRNGKGWICHSSISQRSITPERW